MAARRAKAKRSAFDNDEHDEESLYESPAPRKKVKSEVPESITSDGFSDTSRGSVRSQVEYGESAADDTEDEEDQGGSEEDAEGPYSEKSEPFPNHAAFDQQIPEVQQKLAKLAGSAVASVNETTCNTAQVNELQRMAMEISIIPKHKKQTIGLIGEAGLGKSSLVSSLCDCPNLAKAVDAGKSCTYVITKYQCADPDQKLDFSFTIEFYDSQTIGSVLSNALDDWNKFYNECEDAWTPEELAQYESRASTCLSTFRAIFAEYPEFDTDEQVTMTLHEISRSGTSVHDKTAHLVEMAGDVLQSFLQDDGTFVHYGEANDTGDLWKALDSLITAGPDPDKQSPWPLVKQVSIGVRGPRVLDFYVLVDMPGVSDTNEVRVDATQQFLKQCDYLVIVARAGRMTTDPVVRSILQKYGKALEGSVMIVGTKSDENAGHAEAVHFERLRFDIGNYHDLKASSDAMASQLKGLERASRKTAKGSSKRKNLDSKIGEMQQRKRRVDSACKERIVAARNVHNAARLQDTGQRYLPAGKKLHVFGVSNLHYERLINDEYSTDYQLSPVGTGIPALRHHLLSLVAPRIWNTFKDFISSDITALIPSFEMWAGTGNLASGRVTLVEVVEHQRQQLRFIFEDHQATLMELMERFIVTVLQENQPSCAEAAVSYVQQTLSKWHWKTLESFIKHNGQHKTKVISDSWNQQFTAGATKIIQKGRETFMTHREALVAVAEEKIASAMEDIPQKLRTGIRGVSESAMATFEQGLKGHISGMRQNLRRRDADLSMMLQVIYFDATIDSGDNYFTQAMHKAYETCQEDTGHGVRARCLGVLKKHLSHAGHRSPFASMRGTLRSEIEAAITAHIVLLHADTDIRFRAVLRDVQNMASQKAEHPQERPVRRAVARFVEIAHPMLHEINVLVQDIDSRYPIES